MNGQTVQQARSELAASLRKRREEIEEAALARVAAISDPAGHPGPIFAESMRQAAIGAIAFGIDAIEFGDDVVPHSSPPAVLAHARLAAQSRVRLDTVLRRYSVGFGLFSEYVAQEARATSLGEPALHQLHQGQTLYFDRLLAAVSEEYIRHGEILSHPSRHRQAERVKRLLAGELTDTTQLGYELDVWHVAVVSQGECLEDSVRCIARKFGTRILVVSVGVQVWAWLGSHCEFSETDLEGLGEHKLSPGTAVAVGEPAKGLAGWRLTHRQAMAAMPLAMRRPGTVLRYGDVALPAALVADDLLGRSLRMLYLDPLRGEGDGHDLVGATRAFIEAGGNISSAAAALGISRHTVSSRLRASEQILAKPLHTCLAELSAVFTLDELETDTLPGASANRGL